jgi:predicted nucleic acid-binding protein
MTNRAILADTGPLYAAVDQDDAFHERAQRELRRVAREKLDVLISYSTLLETYSLLLRRLGSKAGTTWLADVLSGASFINPNPEDYLDAATRVVAFPDQDITLCDATLAVLAERLRVEVWTYGHHFDVMRTKVWRR